MEFSRLKTLPLLAATAFLLLAGCAAPVFPATPTPTPTLQPTPTPPCLQPGATVTDRVVFSDSGEDHQIIVHLPPCYAQSPTRAYPVLYWTNGGAWPDLFDTADALGSQGDTPAFILVMVEIDPNKGFGADAQIVETVVPYIDSHYRTQPDRAGRSLTGFSHGAAIAIRSAFRAPSLFGRVAVQSGGIADGEQEKFTAWVNAMLPDQCPQVLINVGEQDGVIVLTNYLMALLDQLDYPYTYLHAPGGHTGEYMLSHMHATLKWLMSAPTK